MRKDEGRGEKWEKARSRKGESERRVAEGEEQMSERIGVEERE